jgi:ribosomal protein S18 acetylase RimI-like enzyme
VHRIYEGTGFIHPDSSGMRIRLFEASPETATFIAKDEHGEVVGVVSIVGDSEELGLPSDGAFGEELNALRRQGLRLCEWTNQVLDERYRSSSLATELMRVGAAHVFESGYDKYIATVSASHTGFYQLLGYTEIGAERSYSQEIDDPVVALAIDASLYTKSPSRPLNEAEQFLRTFMADENPYVAHVARWKESARRQFLDSETLHDLFVRESDFLRRWDEEERQKVEDLWTPELFAAVQERTLLGRIRGCISRYAEDFGFALSGDEAELAIGQLAVV